MRAWMVAAVLWLAALSLTGAGMTFAPTESCGDDNKSEWVLAADRAGRLFGIAAVLGAVATPFLVAEAAGRRGRGYLGFALMSVASFAAALFLGVAAFANLVLQCLE